MLLLFIHRRFKSNGLYVTFEEFLVNPSREENVSEVFIVAGKNPVLLVFESGLLSTNDDISGLL